MCEAELTVPVQQQSGVTAVVAPADPSVPSPELHALANTAPPFSAGSEVAEPAPSHSAPVVQEIDTLSGSVSLSISSASAAVATEKVSHSNTAAVLESESKIQEDVENSGASDEDHEGEDSDDMVFSNNMAQALFFCLIIAGTGSWLSFWYICVFLLKKIKDLTIACQG